jgi:sugar (pentulose or hexulose) kinase
LFLPSLVCITTLPPHLDPTMRGCWLGLSSKHTRTDLLHAALLGVACAARQALDALVAIQPVAAVGALRLAGGGTVSAPWRQLVPELGATTTPVATRRSGTTVRSLISGGALTNAINGAIAVLDPGS